MNRFENIQYNYLFNLCDEKKIKSKITSSNKRNLGKSAHITYCTDKNLSCKIKKMLKNKIINIIHITTIIHE